MTKIKAAIEYATRSFTLAGQTVIHPDDPAADSSKTPDIAILPLADRSASKVYRHVVEFENETLSKNAAPAHQTP